MRFDGFSDDELFELFRYFCAVDQNDRDDTWQNLLSELNEQLKIRSRSNPGLQGVEFRPAKPKP